MPENSTTLHAELLSGRVKWAMTVGALVVFVGRSQFEWLKQASDGFGIALLFGAALPWAASLFKSVKIPNVLEAEFRSLEERVEEVRSTAAEAVTAADRAVRQADAAAVQPVLTGSQPGDAPPSQSASGERNQIVDLAQRFADIRARQPSGPARTRAMTALFKQMVSYATRRDTLDFNGLLSSESIGERLLGVAYAYANPHKVPFERIVNAALAETLPFTQYWALRASREVLANNPDVKPDDDLIAALDRLREKPFVQSDSSRVFEIRGLLADIEQRRKM